MNFRYYCVEDGIATIPGENCIQCDTHTLLRSLVYAFAQITTLLNREMTNFYENIAELD
jgi:hypothetical protein